MSDTEGTDGPAGAEPRYAVAAVARRLGVAAATLRTWDRRYGLGPSGHAFGAHRRYTPRDVARLVTMRRLVVDGVPPAEAARIALAREVADDFPAGLPVLPSLPVPPAGVDGAGPGGAGVDGAGVDGAGPGPAGPVRGGGGRVLALPGATPEVRGLAAAAMALDTRTITSVVRTALRTRGVAAAWHELVAPVLVAVGERWAATQDGVDIEHLLSESALVALREVRLLAGPAGEPRVVLACVAGEYHALPVHVLAAALAERDIPVRLLGAAVPPAALAAALRRVRPAVLFCWASLADPGRGGPPGHAGYLDALPQLAPPVSVVVGGPGWTGTPLPPRTDVARDVTEAVALVAARLGH